MRRLRLLHWKEEETAPRANALRRLGYEVDATRFASSSMKEFRENPPDAVVIDLSRLPSHGREVGVFLRGSKSTRLIPLIFVEGDREKVDKVKSTLPDARYSSYAKIAPVLEDVLANPPKEAYIPKPHDPVTLIRKLGIKDGATVGLINAPKGFEAQIPTAATKRNSRAKVRLTLWFIETRKALEADLPKIRQCAEDGGVWIIWPKQTKSTKPDVNGNIVRQLALAAGLVDFKICAVDETWSGMRFAIKHL